MLKSKLYKYLGLALVYILGSIASPIAASFLKDDHKVLLGLLTAGTVVIIAAGCHCNRKAEEIARELTIKSTLDEESLGTITKLNGLMFSRGELKEKYNMDVSVNTIRYLIQQNIINNEVFPLLGDNKITCGYNLTTFGKNVLRKHIGLNLFPDIIIDLYKTAYWFGHKEAFPFRKKEFKRNYKKEFDDCINIFFSYIPKCVVDSDNNIVDEKKVDAVRKYLENQEILFNEKLSVVCALKN